jgi:hypothetical protein
MTPPLHLDLGGPAPLPPAAGEAPTTLPTDPHPALETAAPTARKAGGGATTAITKAAIPVLPGCLRTDSQQGCPSSDHLLFVSHKSGNQQGYRSCHNV